VTHKARTNTEIIFVPVITYLWKNITETDMFFEQIFFTNPVSLSNVFVLAFSSLPTTWKYQICDLKCKDRWKGASRRFIDFPFSFSSYWFCLHDINQMTMLSKERNFNFLKENFWHQLYVRAWNVLMIFKSWTLFTLQLHIT
jgi:hypothetical protein